MKFCLDGPYPFDVNAVTACGRAALSGVDHKLRAGLGEQLIEDAIGAEEPGLYVLLSYDEGVQPPDVRIAGLWVAFGIQFLEDGVLGPPDRYPPYAHELLDAAVEEVWWRNLHVARRPGGSWHPVIVLEWPHPLASRAALYPPGVTIRKDVEESMEILQSGVWLGDQVFQQQTVEGEDGPRSVSIEHRLSPFDELPGRRSLVTVIRGKLSQDRVTHQGGFRLLPPASFPGTDMVMLRDQWLSWATGDEEPAAAEAPEGHRLGRPLSLAPGRIGFPLTGWLTRNLELWPGTPREVVPADLTERVVRSRWRAQLVMAAGSTLAVLAMVLGLSLSVQLAAKPRPRPTTTTPLPATQPAMSVCSADHQKFVAEMRCQVEWFASGGSLSEPVCGDPGSPAEAAVTTGDLQAAYCGLLDRERDGWKGNYPGVEGTALYNFAELAASQACFNVLGHPHPYTQDIGYTEDARAVADPDRFLRDRSLRIQSLVDLVGDLDEACDPYRTKLENRVEGAVFATHIGTAGEPGQGSEASRLRDSLMERAVVGMSDDAERCFRLGTQELLAADEYAGLCGPDERLERRLASRKIWGQLGAQPGLVGDEEPPPLLDRYVQARFGGAGEPGTTDLWACHLALQTAPEELRDGQVGVRWDLSLPVPVRYDTEGRGGVRSQLVVDAALGDLEEGLDAGICWAVVGKRLDAYTPVHPLLAELDDDVWVSPEQQLCGQICASYYRVDRSLDDDRWVTRGADLGLCLDASPPSQRPELDRAGLDRLRLPWNETRSASWVEPDAAALCAFNLIAQDYVPAAGESYLVGEVAPAQWAGETYTGSRIAGGEEGLAVRSARNLSSYGRSRSSSTCGHVATQCLTEMMLDIMGDGRFERYEWRSAWRGRVASLAAATPLTLGQYSPWCQQIQPYLHPEGMLPEGEIDYPCAAGVDGALQNVEASIRILASGGGSP